MVFIMDYNKSSNVVKPDTHEEKWEVWRCCIESTKRVENKVNLKFVKTKMFRSCDNSFNSSDSNQSRDNDFIFAPSYSG